MLYVWSVLLQTNEPGICGVSQDTEWTELTCLAVEFGKETFEVPFVRVPDKGLRDGRARIALALPLNLHSFSTMARALEPAQVNPVHMYQLCLTLARGRPPAAAGMPRRVQQACQTKSIDQAI